MAVSTVPRRSSLQFLTRQVVLNAIRRGLAHVQDRLSFDICQLYEALKERGVSYAIRISAKENLERDIAELQPRPVGRPGLKPLVEYKSFLYQAASWKKARRVAAKVEHDQGELFPRVGFIVTNLSLPSRAVVGSTTSVVRRSSGSRKASRR